MICRKTHFNHLFVNAFCFFSVLTFAQEAKTQLDAPEKLTTLLEQKILLDAEASKKGFLPFKFIMATLSPLLLF